MVKKRHLKNGPKKWSQEMVTEIKVWNGLENEKDNIEVGVKLKKLKALTILKH